jgi:hypothetical protein
MMNEPRDRDAARRRHAGRNHTAFGPVVWIAFLLVSWFVLVEWKMLPDVVSATMGALP